jgi:hypothetical protein
MTSSPLLTPIDKDDLWLLEVVAEFATPLSMLMAPDVALALNMPRSHGLSREALCEKLVSLSERGLIRVHHSEDEGEVIHSHVDIDRALVERKKPFNGRGFVYGLTDKGGASWEHYAQPDWSRFIDASVGTEPDECVIEAPSRDLAEEEYQRHEGDGSEYQPLPASKRGEVLVPWSATYWKVLPTGYRLRYEWVPRPQDVRRMMSLPGRVPWYSSLALDR